MRMKAGRAVCLFSAVPRTSQPERPTGPSRPPSPRRSAGGSAPACGEHGTKEMTNPVSFPPFLPSTIPSRPARSCNGTEEMINPVYSACMSSPWEVWCVRLASSRRESEGEWERQGWGGGGGPCCQEGRTLLCPWGWALPKGWGRADKSRSDGQSRVRPAWQHGCQLHIPPSPTPPFPLLPLATKSHGGS